MKLSKLIKDRQFELMSVNATLSNILSQAQATAKKQQKEDLDENEILQLIKTEIKSLSSNLEGVVDKETGKTFVLPEEKQHLIKLKLGYLNGLLPKQLTEVEIKNIIENLNSSGITSMKDVQSHFKSNYFGLYDGALIAKMLKRNI